MSELRERAAIAAMQGLLAKLNDNGERPSVVAYDAVRCADALLAELAKTAPKSEPTAGACTAAERELIEASISSQITNNFQPWYAAIEAVRAERRAASEAKGGDRG